MAHDSQSATVDLGMADIVNLAPRALREVFREGRYAGHTAGLAPGHLQCNLAILPGDMADDFHAFCTQNPIAIPLAGMTQRGAPALPDLGEQIDLRHDLPLYHVYRAGARADIRRDIGELWQDDFTGFAIGCSFTMEAAMAEAGFPLRHIERDVTVPMFRSSIPTRPTAHFGGETVVSMRPVAKARVEEVIALTARFPIAHGAPLHVGTPEAIGIRNLDAPDWGSAVPVKEDEVAVFWACGVTPQVAMMRARLPISLSHAPGAMLVTDIRDGT